ncbi:putative actin cytoskeleton organization protein [Xylaria bambusicola]|uniref:putative actin cytoskeleton organization protein n=1 Tax=Xylaria bambusicola TaxID=326684 RepID=UPI002008C4A1|nr:putative actin cytoskeleton organization protein [Xylaria bambusicola]KAI0505301.1 putative actin cytoskeleton organization protein [Xylaria bambusicola]
MDQTATAEAAELSAASKLNPVEQSQLLLARLMEGGQEDDKTCQALDRLTFLLNDEADWNARRVNKRGPKNFYAGLPPDEEEKKRSEAGSIVDVLDDVCVDTVLGYLDMRQSDAVRDHAVLTASAYFGAAKEKGAQALKKFFFDRVKRGAYDDYIVAFCVSAAVFPIAPNPTVQMFLSEGFLASLAPLMRRKWKSRKVETACLEMLNAASMHPDCRGPIRTYCTEWLEEVVAQDPETLSTAVHAADPDVEMSTGSISMRRHSQVVQNLAAVILAKLTAVPSTTRDMTQGDEGRIQPATTSIEDLSKKFTTLLLAEPKNDKGPAIEGLAYATIKPTVKEEVASNPELLKSLVNTLRDAPAKSLITYGILSIFVNLTRYLPVRSEEEKKMDQLKAYANAAGKLAAPNPLNGDSHVADRCKQVFEAGVISVLVTHSRYGSNASLSLIISIVYSLSVNISLRGQLAQQGAVNLLIAAWTALPDTEAPAKRMAAQSLARILISTNPSLVFGGTRARPQNAAIRPLVSIIPPDPVAETRDLLPSFEALMALTNLASTDDDTRATIIRTALPEIEEQLLSSHHLVSKAATELICNLVQCVEGVALYAAGTTQAADRLHILLALTDAEDEATRSAAGGALASLTAYEEVVRGIIKRKRGVEVVLGLCAEDSEDLRHRGVFIVHNMISQEGEAGKLARKEIQDKDGIEILKTCAKKSRRAEVVEVTAQALKILLEEE